jgi:hypothetical protein
MNLKGQLVMDQTADRGVGSEKRKKKARERKGKGNKMEKQDDRISRIKKRLECAEHSDSCCI